MQIVNRIDARGAVNGMAAQIDAAMARRLPDMQRAAVSAVNGGGRRGHLRGAAENSK